MSINRCAIAAVLAAALSYPASLSAQTNVVGHAPLTDASLAPVPSAPMPPQPGGTKGTLIGAAVGAGAAAAVVYFLAKNYGENRPGEVCWGCFTAWGAWAIPAGALIGGIVGYHASTNDARRFTPKGRQTFVAPVVAPRGGGVVVSLKY